MRIELRTALRRGTRVIPVLIDGCAPPAARRLPEDFKQLVRRQAVSFNFHKFDTDAERLVAATRGVLDAKLPSPARPPAFLCSRSRLLPWLGATMRNGRRFLLSPAATSPCR
jgi:hypothetical protein